jgi:hypothetical protein
VAGVVAGVILKVPCPAGGFLFIPLTPDEWSNQLRRGTRHKWSSLANVPCLRAKDMGEETGGFVDQNFCVNDQHVVEQSVHVELRLSPWDRCYDLKKIFSPKSLATILSFFVQTTYC